MKQIKEMAVKFVILSVILVPVLMALSRLSLGTVLIISLLMTILSYYIGELVILPGSNNTAATLADMGLSFVLILLFRILIQESGLSYLDALSASIGVGAGEWLFHKFVTSAVMQRHR